MQKTFKYLAFFSFLLILNSCKTEALEETMVSFDKAFIPVYYYSYTNDLDSAEKAMWVLDRKWEKLQAQFEQNATDAHNWQVSFQMVSNWLDEAECAINDKNADLALIQLDHARYELMDLRWREGISYYLDEVWDLEGVIDIVVQTTADPKLDLVEWQSFISMVYDVESAWSKVMDKTWETSYFDFTDTEIEEEKTRKLALGIAIKNFKTAVDYADRCEIQEAAMEMEVAYLEYIFFFGDFEATKTFYATNFLS